MPRSPLQTLRQSALSLALIEDDSRLRRALNRLLRAMGHEVATYPSAESFLASGDPRRFDCLLVDVHLKGMGGHALVVHLSQSNCAPPALFMSGSQTSTAMVAAALGPGYRVLQKPFGAATLEAAVAELAAPPGFDST